MEKEKTNVFLPHQLFQLLFLIHLLVSVFILFFSKRGDIILWINSLSFLKLDNIVVIITFFGHGIFALIVCILLLFKKIYYSILLAITLLLVSLFTNIMKHFIFIQYNRPLWAIYYNDLHRVIYDAPVNYSRSFPSGHTMTAFALAAIISMFIKTRLGVIFLFFYALLIAFSRIYLMQHYFEDVFWGSVFGVVAAMLGKIITDKLLGFYYSDFMHLSIQKYIRNLLFNLNNR